MTDSVEIAFLSIVFAPFCIRAEPIMISEELRAVIAKYDQSHILKYYDEGLFTEEEKSISRPVSSSKHDEPSS